MASKENQWQRQAIPDQVGMVAVKFEEIQLYRGASPPPRGKTRNTLLWRLSWLRGSWCFYSVNVLHSLNLVLLGEAGTGQHTLDRHSRRGLSLTERHDLGIRTAMHIFILSISRHEVVRIRLLARRDVVRLIVIGLRRYPLQT